MVENDGWERSSPPPSNLSDGARFAELCIKSLLEFSLPLPFAALVVRCTLGGVRRTGCVGCSVAFARGR